MKVLSKQYIVIIFSIFLGILAFKDYAKAQSAAWVDTQLPGAFPPMYHYGVGETCIIFVDDTSSVVHAFDIYDGNWKSLLVPTELDWEDAESHGNVAMAYNDSVIVGYSALTHTFDALVYSGGILNISNAYGCIDNFAYFVTDFLFYVFDAEDGQWRSFSYTPPGTAPWGGGVRGKEDYIYLDLWILNSPPHTMAAYSLHTKTFAELTESNVYGHEDYDHGFTFFRGNATPYLCGGYSACSGQFQTKTHANYITEIAPSVFPDIVTPVICSMFVTSELINPTTRRFYMWVYNTVAGGFAEYTFDYPVAGGQYVPDIGKCGAQNAIQIIRNGNQGDKLECVLYSALTNSFSHFDTPLFHWGFKSFTCGGLIFDGFDQNNFYMYDVQTGSSFTHPVYWTTGFTPDVEARPIGNYWNIFAYREQGDDTIHVFSYNRQANNLHTFDIFGGNYAVGKGGCDFYRILVTDMSVPHKMHMYSPAYDTWIEKDLANATNYGGEGNYCYIYYPGQNQLYFYDGKANQEYSFNYASGMLTARDSVFCIYSADGKYIGYSVRKNAYSEYVSPLLGGQANKYMVLAFSQYDQLIYDGYNNIFLPLTLTPTHGFRKNSFVGEKTALIMTQNGYLFAYYPGEVTGFDEEEDAGSMQPGTFKLVQNYPNPFNPTTTIRYEIPLLGEAEGGLVTLRIYDILGREVAILVNERRSAGKYQVQWDASGLASGIYLYQLKAGKYTKTRKLVFMK